MSPRFWQTLLGAEPTPAKAREILRELAGFAHSEQRLLEHRYWNPAERSRLQQLDDAALERGLEAGISVFEESDYPPQLPRDQFLPALFTWGDATCLQQPCVAIVGTRAATVYGRAAAAKFAEALSAAGVTIVSGGALGIDAAAHEGALKGGGRTVAVFAGGVDRTYPAKHKMLYGRIRESGALISQFAIGARENAYKFLVRNRLIAGLANIVLVVEAPARSGSLATAHHAAEFGREVFVVPANVENLNFRGSHALIRDGATLCDHPDQILEALGLQGLRAARPKPTLSSEGRQIMKAFSGLPRTADELAELLHLSTAEVLAELSMLEMEGLVLKDGRMYIVNP